MRTAFVLLQRVGNALDGKVLAVSRKGLWSLPGGDVLSSEYAWQGARRILLKETGYFPATTLSELITTQHSGHFITVFVAPYEQAVEQAKVSKSVRWVDWKELLNKATGAHPKHSAIVYLTAKYKGELTV